MESTMSYTKTIYLGKHDQHSVEVTFDIYSEPPDPSVGWLTWYHEIQGVYVTQFNNVKRTPYNKDYFDLLDDCVLATLEDMIPELLEEEKCL